MKCMNCGNKDCINRLWIEENTYLWVAFRDKDGEPTERQILVMDLNDLVALRDEINQAIKQKAGIQ
jgi:hypothetical protein